MAVTRGATNASECVKSASEFAIGGIGVAGTTTRAELALREIEREKNGAEQLRKILHEGSAAGRMYALFGLRQLDTKDYESLAEPYRHSNVPVQRIQGCIITTDPTAEAVRWIDRYAKTIELREK